MTVLLVLITFVAFIVLDWVLSRREAKAKAAQQAPVAVPVAATATPESERWVDGFLLPDNLQYHSGHTWVSRERKNVLRVGVNQFAASLLGKLDGMELPKPGHWVRQGQAVLNFKRRGENAQMLCPVEGEVVALNEAVLKDPSLLRREPYAAGWLMTVYAPDEDNVRRNLLPMSVVGHWLRDAVERLYARQPQLAGAACYDGGQPVEDVAEALGEQDWRKLTAEFFIDNR